MAVGSRLLFKRGEGECGNATRFFGAIARQPISCVLEMKPSIKKAVDADLDICERTLKEQSEKLLL